MIHRILCLLTLAALVACTDDSQLPAQEIRGHAMGTNYQVVIVDPAEGLPLETLQMQLQRRIEQIEDIASTYRDTSAISKFNRSRSTDWIAVPAEFCSMIAAATNISRETAGAFDPTVGALVNLWGFGPDFLQNELPGDAEIARALASSGEKNLASDCANTRLRKSEPGLQIDLSGWAKGYAVDQLADILDAAGQASYLVEIGGEIRVSGWNTEREPFAIAIERPDTASVDGVAVLNVTDTGIATSGDYRNYFEHDGVRYSHTIDPRNGKPVRHTLTAVTVLHPSAAYADAMATALLVLGFDDAIRYANDHAIAAYFAVREDDRLAYEPSAAFAAEKYLHTSADP
tara:strand:- start:14562 stop:15596 length:1035 start_codon:yes stop_codon:yes gene_type:complete